MARRTAPPEPRSPRTGREEHFKVEHEELGTQGTRARLVRRAKGHLGRERRLGRQISAWLNCNYARTQGSKMLIIQTASASTSTGPAESGSRSRPLSPATLEDDFDYADLSTLATTGKVACLLCQRRFPSVEALKKHNAGSDLHKVHSHSKIRNSTALTCGVSYPGSALSSFGVWFAGLMDIVTDAISFVFNLTHASFIPARAFAPRSHTSATIAYPHHFPLSPNPAALPRATPHCSLCSMPYPWHSARAAIDSTLRYVSPVSSPRTRRLTWQSPRHAARGRSGRTRRPRRPLRTQHRQTPPRTGAQAPAQCTATARPSGA